MCVCVLQGYNFQERAAVTKLPDVNPLKLVYCLAKNYSSGDLVLAGSQVFSAVKTCTLVIKTAAQEDCSML